MTTARFLTATCKKNLVGDLGKLEKVGSRASYPLLLRYREQNIAHRFAIVGNAAQTLHPIAGQGFNLGIRDVASLAEEIWRHSNSDDRKLCFLARLISNEGKVIEKHDHRADI